MKFNTNEYVTVIMLPRGCAAYEKYWRRAGLKPPRNLKPGDRYKDQLWALMEMFGPYINLSEESPFETGIEIHEKTLEQGVRLVLEAGLSTGHAETWMQLLREVVDQAVELRDRVHALNDTREIRR